ncbi:hypothetical protein C0989_012372 [Termitomyces sp. Mn162]|nr:hypothetical protein C0989_012372 [Termitomyces sp. Mn162]
MILSIFVGQVLGTSVGTKVFVTYGWRAGAALNMVGGLPELKGKGKSQAVIEDSNEEEVQDVEAEDKEAMPLAKT